MIFSKKYILMVFILVYILLFISCSVKQKNYITVLRTDNSPFYFEITNLWTGKKNLIYGPYDLLSIHTDNGIVNSIESDLAGYYIKPFKNGAVNIYTTHVINNKDGSIDTISGISRFKAITSPQLKVQIDTQLLRDSFVLKYDIVFVKDLKPIRGTRYQIGALVPDTEVFADETKIGEIAFYTEIEEEKELLKKGNRIIFPSIVIRDMRTDLLIGTESIDLRYK